MINEKMILKDLKLVDFNEVSEDSPSFEQWNL